MADQKPNGVNLQHLNELIERVKVDSSISRPLNKARVTWDVGLRTQIHIRNFPPVVSDEPEFLGGEDTGCKPGELALGALGSCLVVGIVMNAALQGITIKELDLEVEANGYLPAFLGLARGNPGYTDLRVHINVKSDATPDQLAALREHVLQTSPVGNTCTTAGSIRVEINCM
jgi:uncharacterized OsmC-like protein